MTKQSIPRYRVLANQLKHDILSGQLKPGEQLHTELELCEIHNISRHTAREALRLLSEDGLIARRRGAGTVVAEINAPAFAQPIGDFDSILKYARDAHFELDTFGPATPAELAAIGLKGVYSRFDGLRGQASAPPLALTVIYALAQLAPDAPTLRSLDTSISEWIERTHAVAVKKVTQRMEAVALKASDAKKLKVEKNSPALATTRTYHDASGRVILYSHSLHPAGRFVYEIQLDRTRS
jgi:GntR family transcriptional regulator|tara:strand:- start:107964 stop:108680 length:717 start_codon:yes stop_codon:yes gene_type:complete